LIKDKTVFILGAGASKPYGFPLWEELKDGMLRICSEYSGQKEYDEWGLDYWQTTLGSNTRKTVDTLAHEANDAARKGFQILTTRILLECEQADSISDRDDWIEVLGSEILASCDRLGAQTVLPNLSIINFNYDRCFAHRFSKFVKTIWDSFHGSWERDGAFPGYGVNFRYHIHPHGAVGGMLWQPEAGCFCAISASTFANFSNLANVPYGDVSSLSSQVNNGKLGVMPVDVVGQETWHNRGQIAYIRANNLLRDAKNVVVIGLSREGLAQCHLSMPETISGWSTGNEVISDQFNSTGCYAKEFAESLGKS